MRYKTRIVGGAVEVYLASHRHCVFLVEPPLGTSPAAYSLRCAERA